MRRGQCRNQKKMICNLKNMKEIAEEWRKSEEHARTQVFMLIIIMSLGVRFFFHFVCRRARALRASWRNSKNAAWQRNSLLALTRACAKRGSQDHMLVGSHWSILGTSSQKAEGRGSAL